MDSVHTEEDGRRHLLLALEQYGDRYDFEAIVHELHLNHGTWDFEAIPTLDYWETVERHELP